MKVSERPIKPIKRQLLELMIFAIIVVLEILFFDQINTFLNSTLKLVSGHKAWIWISTSFIYMPIIFMPFMLLLLTFQSLSKQIQSELTGSNLLKSVMLLHLVSAAFASLFWILQSDGVLNAVLAQIRELNYLLLGAIVFLSYNFAKGLSDPASLAKVLERTIIICFVWVFYFWFGLDDGCTSSGGDGLFTSGEVECDPDFVKAGDVLEKKGAELGFNSNAGFAAQYLWMVSASFVTTLTVYFFKNRKHK